MEGSGKTWIQYEMNYQNFWWWFVWCGDMYIVLWRRLSLLVHSGVWAQPLFVWSALKHAVVVVVEINNMCPSKNWALFNSYRLCSWNSRVSTRLIWSKADLLQLCSRLEEGGQMSNWQIVEGKHTCWLMFKAHLEQPGVCREGVLCWTTVMLLLKNITKARVTWHHHELASLIVHGVRVFRLTAALTALAGDEMWLDLQDCGLRDDDATLVCFALVCNLTIFSLKWMT